MTKRKPDTCHFTIEGAFITDLARRLWVDEDRPAQALEILEGIDGLTEADRLSILSGKKALSGSSDTGLILVESPTPYKSFTGRNGDLKAVIQHLQDTKENIFTPPMEGLIPEGLIPEGLIPNDADPEDADPEDADPEDADDAPPEAGPIANAENGWLSPNGEFYPCKYGEHLYIAGFFRTGNAGYRLEEEGWYKLQRSDWNYTRHKPTQAQLNAIFDWCQSVGKSFSKDFEWMTCED